MKQLKEIKKQALKEKKQQLRKEKLAAVEARRAGMTPEEAERDKQARSTTAKALREQKRVAKAERTARLEKAKEDDTWRIVIDYDFEAQMTPNEIKSIVQQTNFCYGVNGQAKVPVHLVLTSVKDGIKEAFDRQLGEAKYERWVGVTVSEERYVDLYKDKKDQLVYLTADSEVEIQELSPDDVYIIGGIVDRNRHKNICFRRATELGIRTARLPIGKHMLEGSRSVVMCTNHVLEMLLMYLETRDWKLSVEKVLPERKRAA